MEILGDRAKLSDSGTYFVPSAVGGAGSAGSGGSDGTGGGGSGGGTGGGTGGGSGGSGGSGSEEEDDLLDGAGGGGGGGGGGGSSSLGGTQETYLNYIRSLPLNAAPEVFAMHPNASITKEKQDTQALFNCMLLTAPSGGGGGSAAGNHQEDSPESIVDAACTNILNKLPKGECVCFFVFLKKNDFVFRLFSTKSNIIYIYPVQILHIYIHCFMDYSFHGLLSLFFFSYIFFLENTMFSEK